MIDPDSMLTICAAVCLLAIGLYALLHEGKVQHDQTVHAARQDRVPRDEPVILCGTWDPLNLMAEEHWWRCSRCGECEVQLPGHLAAIHAAEHVCTQAALEQAQRDAKAQHPANRELS